MRILITGASGQLGKDCTKILNQHHNVLPLSKAQLDITDTDKIHTCMKEFSPDLVVNCAAFTKVDACETQKDLARKVNALGPQYLAQQAEDCGAGLIHFSTDYVFDGRREVPRPYNEDDTPNPVSYYGKGKLAGEEAVKKYSSRYLILRTAWVYGMGGHNFLKTILIKILL